MTPEERLLKALAQASQHIEPQPDDETLARYIEGRLDREQANHIARQLAANPDLRRQWQAVRESVGMRERQKAWWVTGLASAAVLALASLVVLQSGEPIRPDAGILAENVDLLPQSEPAEALASNAVPLAYWRAFLAGYSGQNIRPEALAEARRWQALGHALNELQARCDNAEALARAQSLFAELVPPYPEVLSHYPAERREWCTLGEALRQRAEMSVKQKQLSGEHP